MTRILVAEDDRHLQRVIQIWLQRHGYTVRCAKDGKNALAIYKDWLPELVITDVNMPEMDGVSLARAVLSDESRRTGIIILSCRVDMIGPECELGDELVISHAKPFSPSRIIQELEVLRRRVNAPARSAEPEPILSPRRAT